MSAFQFVAFKSELAVRQFMCQLHVRWSLHIIPFVLAYWFLVLVLLDGWLAYAHAV